MIKLLNIYRIKERTVAFIDVSQVPRGGLRIGILVHQGDKAWKLIGVASNPRGAPITLDTIVVSLQGVGHDEPPVVGDLFL